MREIAFAILRRLLILVPVLWAVVTLVFLLIHLVPGDPAELLLGPNATPEQVQTVREQLGLDKPIITQYKDYWVGLFSGDWGTNPVTGKPVLERIMSRYPATILLAVTA
ncbi:MAG TPA: ABC transporter permease, partial [Blastocatellia bacterium]|nr:ABC transporter permease [Blastocatellia bacterium]